MRSARRRRDRAPRRSGCGRCVCVCVYINKCRARALRTHRFSDPLRYAEREPLTCASPPRQCQITASSAHAGLSPIFSLVGSGGSTGRLPSWLSSACSSICGASPRDVTPARRHAQRPVGAPRGLVVRRPLRVAGRSDADAPYAGASWRLADSSPSSRQPSRNAPRGVQLTRSRFSRAGVSCGALGWRTARWTPGAARR